MSDYSLVFVARTQFGDYVVRLKRGWTGASSIGQNFPTFKEAMDNAEAEVSKLGVGSRIVNNVPEEFWN
jgi:hypothetical protein